MCVPGRGPFVARRLLDDARQRDAAAGQGIGFALGRHDRDAGPRIACEIAAVLGQVGHAQHRRAAEQSVGDERRPRIAVGGQRRQRAGVGRRRDRAGLLGRRRTDRIGDRGKRGRDRRGIARVSVITGRHVGTIPVPP